MTDKDTRLNWSKLEPEKAAARVQSMIEKHEKILGWRHAMAWRGALAYGGLGLGDLFDGLSFSDQPWAGNRRRGRKKNGGWADKTQEQHARAAAVVISEKLTGLDQPKTEMVGTDCEWELRRQGVWAARFCEGNMHQQQGMFKDTWDVARHGFLLAAASTGVVAARVEPDYVSKRVRTQLRSTLQTFIDPGDVANGQPLTFVDVTWENPEYMIEDDRFKKHTDLIMSSAIVPPHHRSSEDGATFETPMVKWASAWRMPFGKFKGREAVFVGGKQVLWEDWDSPSPPLALFRMNRCLDPGSFWGENLIEIMLDPLRDAEDIDDLAKQTMSRTSQTYISMGSSTQGPAAVMNAKDVNVFRYDLNKNERDVNIQKPDILAQQYFDWQTRKIQLARELVHLGSMHATGESPKGTDSGRAKRLEASLLPEAYAKKLRNWRDWVAIDIATLQIRAARQIGKVDPDWQVTWPGADFDSKVSVEVLDIDDSIYQLRPYAVSEVKNTPADRVEQAQEMFDRKQISAEQLSIIVNGVNDTPKETKTGTAERRLCAKTLDEMLHADEEVIGDESRYMAESYMPPPPWIDPSAAMSQAIPQYINAMVDGVPQNRRALMRRYIEDLVALKAKQDREMAMSQASVSVAATPEQAFPNAELPAAPMGAPLPPEMPMAPEAAGLPAVNVGGAPGMV